MRSTKGIARNKVFHSHSTCRKSWIHFDEMTILIVSNTDQLECDFDKYRTNIYSCLQERDWNGVIYQSHFFPAEARTYVYRRDPKTNALRWRVLPIHGAILAGAPLNVVEALLTAYPDGAKSVDDQGMLPIHLGAYPLIVAL